MSQRFDPDHKATLDAMLLDVPGVTAGQMFGHPTYKIAGKVFATLMENGVTVKLPEDAAAELLAHDYAVPFAPMGNPMRQWVLIQVADAEEYARHQPALETALSYVLAEATKSP